MNHRIKRLAGQALDQAVPETWSLVDTEQLEKIQLSFAQLLVSECAVLVQDLVDRRIPASEYPDRIRKEFDI